jgi:uncharacterized membrane protein
MIPVIEIRGAIPLALGMDLGLPEWLVLIITFIGNLIPIPFIYFFARRFLEWGAKREWEPIKKFCSFCLKKGNKAGDKLLKKAGSYGTYLAVFLFVAIPIPGTGAWTGTLAASILNLDFKKTVIAIVPGVLVAGIITLLISMGVIKWLF